MFGTLLLSFIVGVGTGTWIYTKLQRRTGYGNSKTAAQGALAAGVGIFLVVYMTALLIS